MDRRRLLKTGGLGLLGLGFGGCAVRSSPAGSTRAPVRVPPVRASWDRVIRTTVGLRPYRPSGFLVAAERLDDKTVVHNYGHGGAGMSLSWGTGQLAADLAAEHPERRAAVIGCGVIGLTSARQLQRRGFDVSIYAMSLPPHTTSNMSLAGWTPTSGLVTGRGTPEWEAQFRRAAEIAYQQLQLLVGRGYGISWMNTYSLRDEPPEQPAGEGRAQQSLLPPHLRPGSVLLGPSEHPFPTRYATERPTLRIEPSVYLDALVRDVQRFGSRIVVRRFDTRRDLMTLDEPIIVNCTGLGARSLFGDEQLVPVKGQLTHLVPQPEIEYGTFGGLPDSEDRDFGVHMYPRTDGIALGSTSEEGVWSLEPNEEARQQIVAAHIALFAAMRRLRANALGL